jgi:pimeloyl-ACP methyl ester carboxylesterase
MILDVEFSLQGGYGASSSLTSPNSLSRMADDAAAVCQVLGVDHAYCVGLSMGGALAVMMPCVIPIWLMV